MNPVRNRDVALRLAVLLVVTGALLLGGCYPGGPESLDEIGLVVTSRNPDGDFSNLMTYAMEDTVVQLDTPDDSSEPLDPQYNPTILASLQAEMEKAGFRRVDPDAERPDTWLAVGAVKSEVWFYYYNWGYWGGYWGPGYYPPYYGGVGNFDQGTVVWLLMDLRDLPDPIPEEPEPVLNWTGAINGALQEGSPSTIEAGIESGISQAFIQSPYVKASGTGGTK